MLTRSIGRWKLRKKTDYRAGKLRRDGVGVADLPAFQAIWMLKKAICNPKEKTIIGSDSMRYSESSILEPLPGAGKWCGKVARGLTGKLSEHSLRGIPSIFLAETTLDSHAQILNLRDMCH